MAPIFFAIIAGVLIIFATSWSAGGNQRSGRRNADNYKRRRGEIVRSIEALDARLRQVVQWVAQASEVPLTPGSARSINHQLSSLERLVRSFEVIVAAFVRVPIFGTDPNQLDSAAFLLRDFSKRLTQLEAETGMRRQSVALMIARLISVVGKWRQPARGGTTQPATGCYFCSRPFHVNLGNFSMVRVKIEKEVCDVFSCDVCRESLERTKKVKVLYFMQDGRPVHWMEIPGGFPGEQFWSINAVQGANRTMPGSNLRLVTSDFSDHSE
jgi:hypothetical protein